MFNIKNSYNSTRKKFNWIQKWGKDMTRHFSRDNIQMANKQIKRCRAPLIMREMQAQCCKITPHTSYVVTIKKRTIHTENNQYWLRKQRKENICILLTGMYNGIRNGLAALQKKKIKDRITV